MPEPITDVKPTAPVTAVTPAPGASVQPTPAAPKAGEPSRPDAKPVVPLPALQEERSKRQEAESRQAALEAEVAELKKIVQQAPNQFQQPVQQPMADPKEELNKLWEEDPRKAVERTIMYAMDWRDQVDASLELQADNLARKYPDFNNYRGTALGQVRSLPLNQRGGHGILEAAYWMVRGQNADSIIQQRENELLEKYRRGEITAASLMTPPGSFSSPAPAQGVTLTEDQIRVADAMGLTPDQYASQIKRAS